MIGEQDPADVDQLDRHGRTVGDADLADHQLGGAVIDLRAALGGRRLAPFGRPPCAAGPCAPGASPAGLGRGIEGYAGIGGHTAVIEHHRGASEGNGGAAEAEILEAWLSSPGRGHTPSFRTRAALSPRAA